MFQLYVSRFGEYMLVGTYKTLDSLENERFVCAYRDYLILPL